MTRLVILDHGLRSLSHRLRHFLSSQIRPAYPHPMKPIPEDLNKAFESKVRLGIMSVLMANESVDFVTMKSLLELTDGNLASHTRSLEALGYLQSSKQFIGRKPNTTFAITKSGREAFIAHINALEAFLKERMKPYQK